MIVNVTQEHINNGKRAYCSACPVALAIRDCVKPEVGVWVDAYFIHFSTPHPSFKTPPNAKQFILDFDSGCRVQPICFELDIPQELLK